MMGVAIGLQLDLFRPYLPPVKPLTFKQKWWLLHNYEPKIGELTFMPTISKKLDGSGKLYTVGQIGYIHEVDDGKVIVFMPEVWYDYNPKTTKCYEDEWFVLDYFDCDPVTRYGFNRTEWEKTHANAEFPVLRIG